VSHLAPGDYFAINVPVEKMKSLNLMGYHIEELPVLEQQVEEKVEGRTGGAVSLAIGMAKIFSALPGFRGLMAYWYHFAIMFEALFILTTIDTGTRIARFVLQEFLGKAVSKFSKTDWLPGSIVTSALTVGAWGYFIYTGSIATIWPMFGIANQLLAAIALSAGTTLILKSGKLRYAWVTFAPMVFVLITTSTAAWEMVTTTFLKWAQSPVAAERTRGIVDISLTVVIVVCVSIVLLEAIKNWRKLLKIKTESP
jgi:carbon starvation protein